MPYLFQKRGIRVIYKGGIFVQKPVAVNPQRICKCYRCAVLDGVPVIFIQNQCRGHNAHLFRQFSCGKSLECPVILQILARCGAFFIGFVVKGQMNHDFAFRIEVNPCVIEITIGNPIYSFLFFHFLKNLPEHPQGGADIPGGFFLFFRVFSLFSEKAKKQFKLAHKLLVYWGRPANPPPFADNEVHKSLAM